VRCELPVGLRATDALMKILTDSGAILPDPSDNSEADIGCDD
jgi:hypothetical protein